MEKSKEVTLADLGYKIQMVDGRPVYDGDLDLSNTSISSLPEGLIVRGYLDLRNTKKVLLPKNLTVRSFLDLSYSKTVYLPKNLTVGGVLDLSYSEIISLPKGLVVGLSLILNNTKITSLPEGLVVGGCLCLRYTPITFLPEDLTVGLNLDLRNSKIASLPKNITFKGILYLNNTGITFIPKSITVGGYLYFDNSNDIGTSNVSHNVPQLLSWKDGKYIEVDGIFSEVVSHKGNVYRVKRIGGDDIFHVVTDGNDKWAHGGTLKTAKEGLIYKISNRDKSKYKDLSLESQLTYEQSIECYRVITGACSFGTKDFVVNRLKDKKDMYTIEEIINLTDGEFGNKEFKEFFNHKN